MHLGNGAVAEQGTKKMGLVLPAPQPARFERSPTGRGSKALCVSGLRGHGSGSVVLGGPGRAWLAAALPGSGGAGGHGVCGPTPAHGALLQPGHPTPGMASWQPQPLGHISSVSPTQSSHPALKPRLNKTANLVPESRRGSPGDTEWGSLCPQLAWPLREPLTCSGRSGVWWPPSRTPTAGSCGRRRPTAWDLAPGVALGRGNCRPSVPGAARAAQSPATLARSHRPATQSRAELGAWISGRLARGLGLSHQTAAPDSCRH